MHRLHEHRRHHRHRRPRRRLPVASLVVLALSGAMLTASEASAHEPDVAPVGPVHVGDVGPGSFDVDWSLPEGADHSRLVVATDAGMQRVVWSQDTADLDPHVSVQEVLTEGSTYFVQVTPEVGAHDGTPSDVQYVMTTLRPPGDLARVDLDRVGTDGFTLSWDAPDDATGYHVVASAHADLSDPFLDSAVSETSVRVAVPRDGARYYASVTPLRVDLESAPTILSVAVPLKQLGVVRPPTALPASGGTFDVRWAGVANATGYRVSIAASRGGKALWTSAPTDATSLRTPRIRSHALRGVVWVRVTANRFGQTARTSGAVPTVRVDGKVTGKPALVLKVASYNLLEPKYGTPDDAGWQERFRAEGRALRGYDVAGLQEAPASYGDGPSPQAVVAKASGLTLATHPGSHVDCAVGKVPLLYDASRLDLRECGSVDVSVSGHDQRRYVTWAVLRDTATGRSVFVADTHLTAHVANGSSAAARRDRLRQARKVVQAISRHDVHHLPVILVGDLNSYLGAAATPVDVLAAAGLADSELTAATRVGAQWNSLHGFHRTRRAGHHIDHVLTSAGTRVLRFEVERTHERTAPSDHHRISATVAIG